MSRKYKVPDGGTSVSVGGETYEANKRGVVEVPDEASHDDLLSHGFTLVVGKAAGDADPADPTAT